MAIFSKNRLLSKSNVKTPTKGEKTFNLYLRNGPNPASFCSFSFFSYDIYSTNLNINYKSIDGVLGTRTQGGRMVSYGGTPNF